MKKRVIILSGNGTPAISAANIYFAKLQGSWEVSLIEESNFTLTRIFTILKKRFQKKGLINCADMLLGRVWVMFFGMPFPMEKNYVPDLSVQNMNEQAVLDYIKSKNPDVIISNACSILTKDFLKNIQCQIVNVHNGITPRYRGSGNFWAMREDNPDLSGVTVHLVDPGVDTGKRLRVQKISYSEAIDFRDIDRVAFQKGAELVVDYLETGREEIPEEYLDLCDGIYSFSGLTDWFIARRNYKKLCREKVRMEEVFLDSFEKQSQSEELSTLQKLHWHDDASCKRRDEQIKILFAKHASPTWSLLDVGCGDGRYESLLSPGKYVGCDYFVEEANRDRIVQCSAESLPFSARSFDCVVGIGLFQHLSRSQRAGDEMRRVTRKGGIIILNTLRQFSLFELMVIGTAFFWDHKRLKLVWAIFTKDYFSGKEIGGVLVARRYSKRELLRIFKKESKDVEISYDGLLGTRLFSRETTMLIRN